MTTMNDESTFEARLTATFGRLADGARVDVDAVSLAAAVATSRRGGIGRWFDAMIRARTGSRWLVPILVGLLLLGLLAAAIIGARLLPERPEPLTRGVLESTGSMAEPRVAHTATLLADGRVLVTGGFTYLGDILTTDAAETYDPVMGTFTVVGHMHDQRERHVATRLADGHVLITGGEDNDAGEVFASAESFDPTSGTFSPAASMTSRREDHTAVLLRDGRVLVVGGRSDAYADSPLTPGIEVYDPTSDAWEVVSSTMSLGARNPTAIELNDGRVLITGARDLSSRSPSPTGTPYLALFEPGTGSYSLLGSASTGSTDPTWTDVVGAVEMPDGRVLLVDQEEGSVGVSRLLALDVSQGTFAKVADLPGPLTAAPVALGDGRVLFILASNTDCGSVSAFRFDPTEVTFEALGAVPRLGTCNGGGGLTATALADGTALIAGGHLGGGEAVVEAARLLIVETQ